MAGRTILGEAHLSPFCIPRHSQYALIIFESLLAIRRRRRAKNLLRPLADFGIAMLEQPAGLNRIKFGGFDGAGFEGVKEKRDALGALEHTIKNREPYIRDAHWE